MAPATSLESQALTTLAVAPVEPLAGATPMVRHFQQTFLWPIYVLPMKAHAEIQDHCATLLNGVAASPWQEVADEFTGDPAHFQERHYNEFVTFLPPVQRFPLRSGLGQVGGSGLRGSPIRVLRRRDIAAVRVTLTVGTAPIVFDIAHIDLYFFYDIDVAILALEVSCNDIPLTAAQEAMFRMGRPILRIGTPPEMPVIARCWSSGSPATGTVLARSDYENRSKFLGFVC